MEPTREQSFLRRTAEIEQHNAELRAENAELRAQNAKLLEQNAQLTAKVAKLTEQVARLSKNSSNSSKPPSSHITSRHRTATGVAWAVSRVTPVTSERLSPRTRSTGPSTTARTAAPTAALGCGRRIVRPARSSRWNFPRYPW